MQQQAPDYLALHADLTRLVNAGGRSRAAEVARRLRSVVARLALADSQTMARLMATDPAEGLRHAVTLAADAGVTWHDIAAICNQASAGRSTH